MKLSEMFIHSRGCLVVLLFNPDQLLHGKLGSLPYRGQVRKKTRTSDEHVLETLEN